MAEVARQFSLFGDEKFHFALLFNSFYHEKWKKVHEEMSLLASIALGIISCKDYSLKTLLN